MGGCGCSSTRNFILVIFASFSFKSSATNYASADDAASSLRIVQRVNTTPLRWVGCLSCGDRLRKKCLGSWMGEYLSDK